MRFSPAFLGGGNERRGQFFVEKEEVFDAFPVVLERLRAVAEGNGAEFAFVNFCETLGIDVERRRERLRGDWRVPKLAAS